MQTKSGRTGYGCGVFTGMSGSGCGNVKGVCFPFQSYLHDYISRCQILKTCNLWLVSYCVIRNFVHISIKSQNYSHLKSTRPVARKSKVIRPGSGCGVCVGCPRKRGMSGSGCGFETFWCLLLSICICNYIHRHHILKLWNHTLWRCGYCNTHKMKRSSATCRNKPLSASMLKYSGAHRPHIQCLD